MCCYKLGSPGKHTQSTKYLLQYIQCGVHYVFMNMNTGSSCGFIKTGILFQATFFKELPNYSPISRAGEMDEGLRTLVAFAGQQSSVLSIHTVVYNHL